MTLESCPFCGALAAAAGSKTFYVEPHADGSLDVVVEPSVGDVMEVVREFLEARKAYDCVAECDRVSYLGAQRRFDRANKALLDLVAPRAAEDAPAKTAALEGGG